MRVFFYLSKLAPNKLAQLIHFKFVNEHSFMNLFPVVVFVSWVWQYAFISGSQQTPPSYKLIPIYTSRYRNPFTCRYIQPYTCTYGGTSNHTHVHTQVHIHPYTCTYVGTYPPIHKKVRNTLSSHQTHKPSQL